MPVYFQFEFKVGYKANREAGEEISFIDRSLVASPETPLIDFWLFDDDLVGLMRYDKKGRFLRMECYDDPDYLTRIIKLRNDLLERSIPISEVQLSGYRLVHRKIRVHGLRRAEPNLKLLARALVDLARTLTPEQLAELTGQAAAEEKRRNGPEEEPKRAA